MNIVINCNVLFRHVYQIQLQKVHAALVENSGQNINMNYV